MNKSTLQDMDTEQTIMDAAPHKRINWPIIAGLVLVTIITLIAIIGPRIAPKDPAEEHNITMINGQWYIPPFDIGTPGYPLGSDSFGRDLYSRLLWGIRPTLIMVFVVAVVRLVLGVIIGLSAGWFTGKTGRFLNGLIQVALALPVLLVALGAIIIVGVEFGIWAFIIGLSLTGWVDTALQVREQTRVVKGQVYVEAANAIGASNQQILSNHILKQISPMLLMLFAFEVSSTLMLTAGLGFLGYYIGGDVWVETDDFVARRISGNPELGQMLATSWVTLTKPWAMVAVGTTIFFTVLGFNLIGEGLRQNMGFAKVQKRGFIADKRGQFGMWLDQNIWHPAIQFTRIRPLRLGLTLIATFFFLTYGAIVMLDAAPQADVSKIFTGSDLTAQLVPEGSTPLADESILPDGSIEDPPQHIIAYDPNIAWEFLAEGGFSGGPAISPDEKHLYYASQAGNVFALDLDGTIIWQTQLSSGAVGTPALDESGNLIIAESHGGLTKLSEQGEVIWQFQTEAGDRSLAGPAVSSDSTIYYTAGTSAEGYVQAVSSSGESLWVTKINTPFFYETPHPSKDGEYVFLKNDIFSADNGDLIELESDLEVLRYFSGENGKNYMLAGHKIIQWEQSDNTIEILDVSEWDSSNFSDIIAPTYVGVNKDGVSLQIYTSPGGNTRNIWVSEDDQSLGASEVRISSSTFIDMRADLSTFICGGGPFNPGSTDCASLNPSSNDPIWKFHLGNYGPVAGGVIVNQRYFITTEDGYAFEINENIEEVLTQSASESQNPAPGIPTEPGVLWTYQASDAIAFDIEIGQDGLVYISTDDGKLHIIEPGGKAHNIIELPGSPYHHFSQTGRSAALQLSSKVLPDGTIIFVSNENIVFALDSEGNQLWEHALQEEPAGLPLTDNNGNYYLLDLDAGLNSFGKDGLNWRLQSEAAYIPANGFTLGPDGTIYFVVTNYSKGFIQAVSTSGSELWSTEATTIDFYDDLHISSDGRFISLAENLIDTSNGEIIEYKPANMIDEFIFGEGDHNFSRSQHTVTQLQLGSSGVQLLSEGIVSEEDTTLRPPLGSSADSKGIVWLYYPEKYFGGGIIVVWMTSDGELLGNHLVERNEHTLVAYDMEKSLLTECKYFELAQTMDCKAYSPTVDEPVWEFLLKDISNYHGAIIDHDYMYIIGYDNVFSAVYIGDPGITPAE